MPYKNVAAIILAAGEGTRMKSSRPKVLHALCGRPMLGYVLDLANGLKLGKSILVLGHKYREVSSLLGGREKFVLQPRLLGTGDAVKCGMKALRSFKGDILILYGDAPLLKKETIEKLLKYHTQSRSDATVLTAKVDKPAGYGRVLRDKYFNICGIKEEKDADDFEKEIKEINTGIICFRKEALLCSLGKLKAENRKKEYYLTDAIGIIYKAGGSVDNILVPDADEAMGINSKEELSRANSIMQKRINRKFMEEGVSIVDPATTFISYGTKIGADTVIYPFTVIERDVRIGSRCSVGPFAHLREGTSLKDDVLVGNFIETVRSEVLPKTWIKHFSYIGDARIGRRSNIGAGFVTANFNGRDKNLTVIGDDSFIGSDTVLIAPVKLGKRVRTGAGSIVTAKSRIKDGETVAGVPARILKRKTRG